MLFALSVILVFILSFAIITGLYVVLVAIKLIGKKRVEKLFRLVLVYSAFITAVYIYQHIFL